MGIKEQFLEALRPAFEDTEVNGVTVRVNGLSAEDVGTLSEMADGMDATFWVLSRALSDPATGERLFEPDDFGALDMTELKTLTDKTLELSNLDTRAGNSGSVPPSDISSDSQSESVA